MEYLSRKEVAERFGVTPQTVDSWIRTGRLQAIQFVKNGAVRIPISSVERLEESFLKFPSPA